MLYLICKCILFREYSNRDVPIGISNNAKDTELKQGYFSVEGGNVRYWLDGINPSSTVGHLIWEGDAVVIAGVNNLLNLKFIRTGSTTTTIRVSYEK